MKRICPNCGTRYYDFKKDPPACPSCGAAYDPEALLKSRRTRAVANDEPVKRKKAVKAVIEDDVPLVDADEEIDAAIEEEEVEVAEAEVVEGGDEILEDDDDGEIALEDVEVEEEEN
jgi:uncharacterized protein (TIGR02300 family)